MTKELDTSYMEWLSRQSDPYIIILAAAERAVESGVGLREFEEQFLSWQGESNG
jgi:hypothetical protein